jgi:asparagine synthase (glutamine-hydrolysing)
MCGICGFVSNKLEKKETLIKMNDLLYHRGPDDHGEELYQIINGKLVGFAQRRLSIIDLSEKGHQPMHSTNKRITVIFNGEIYNYYELRNEINEYNFISNCDTEVIIAAYLKWGIDFVHKINGMFAIALLDREKGIVYLIRDRIGKKPLYYYKDDENNIVFASELKAILQSTLFKKEINQSIVGRFLYRGYIATSDTIYKNTFKLEPGSILKIVGNCVKNYKYWDVAEKYNELKNNSVINYQQAKNDLKELLKKAVARRMMADVPVGAFLSGGYDSSLVCAIAQELSAKPIKTYSIGFYDEKFDEAKYAKQISNILGTKHEELYIDEQDMINVLENLPYYYDEPFADSSQIPTMLVSELAKKEVSVVLSGDGGDELFGGYNIYVILQQVQRRKMLGRLLYQIGRIPGMRETKIWKNRSIIYRILSDDNNFEAKTQSGVNTYFDKINEILLQPVNNFYYEFESHYHEKRYDVIRMLLDMDTYLPEDILAKVDRASMKYSLECRCPILDKEIIEFSYRLPLEFKISNRNKKRILKDIAYDYIPFEVLDRPKTGFSIPLDKWLRGALKEQLMEWTNYDYLIKQGIFEPNNTIEFINTYMKKGDIGKWSGQNFSKIVWTYFVFQQWYHTYEVS